LNDKLEELTKCGKTETEMFIYCVLS